jgi:hypothetical protein
MDRSTFPNLLGGLALLCLLLGILASLIGGGLFGYRPLHFHLAGLALAMSSFSYLVAVIPKKPPIPPCPPCPPFCPGMHHIALGVFILAGITSLFLGSSLVGITVRELYVVSVTLSVLHLAGVVVCLLNNAMAHLGGDDA